MVKIRKNKFECCISIINALRNSDGLNLNRIYYKSNTNPNNLRIYLDFLLSIDFIGSRPPEKNENSGPVKEIYFLKPRGLKFIKGWDGYRAKYDLDRLEKELQNI